MKIRLRTCLGSALRSSARVAADRYGIEIGRARNSETMRGALRRLAERFTPATVIDVGASDGRWSELAREFFPDSAYLLLEAQASVHSESQARRVGQWPKAYPVWAAAGPGPGTVHFDSTDPFGGAAAEYAFSQGDKVVRMTSVDVEVESRQLPGPYLIKLDTHGFERQILDGAARTLPRAKAVIIEAYNFELRPGELRFHELCDYMAGLGYRPVDLVDVLRRPSDALLWQFDLVFARAEDAVFDVDSYR